jgi:DNA-binding NtrC family response regulator
MNKRFNHQEESMSTAATVLVVDDRANWRELLTAIFVNSEEGYSVKTAASLADASVLIEKHQFSLVITNLGLEPKRGSYDRSGLQVVEKLQQLAPGTPCIILTAYDDAVRDQVQGYCKRYEAPIKVMWKWGTNVYRDLKETASFALGVSSTKA